MGPVGNRRSDVLRADHDRGPVELAAGIPGALSAPHRRRGRRHPAAGRRRGCLRRSERLGRRCCALLAGLVGTVAPACPHTRCLAGLDGGCSGRRRPMRLRRGTDSSRLLAYIAEDKLAWASIVLITLAASAATVLTPLPMKVL